MSEKDRTNQADFSFKSFNVHLKDSYENYPTPSHLSRNHQNLKNSIQGKITYVEFFPKKYNYDVIYAANSADVTLRVKVNFINPNAQDLENYKKKFLEAEKIWNSNQIPMDFNYKFQFQVVTSAKEAHFSVLVLDDTRGPYDTSWGRNWTSTTIAHELGHMMGLGDESSLLFYFTSLNEIVSYYVRGQKQGCLFSYDVVFQVQNLHPYPLQPQSQ